MTTSVERTYEVEADIEDVWAVISDASFRAEAISVVEQYHTIGEETVWKLSMPVRAIPGTISVRTRDVERNPPRYVRFVGRSKVMDVEGEHELTPSDDGCVVTNRFVVDGHLPGVESYFKRHIDDEIDNLLSAVASNISTQQRK